VPLSWLRALIFIKDFLFYSDRLDAENP
jgi:hypothetical protein